MSQEEWVTDDQVAEVLKSHPDATANVLNDDLSVQAHTITLAKAKAEAKALVAELFESWLQLKHIVNQHGPTVQKRWMKKNKEQRKRLLLKAWPRTPGSHRPGISYLAQRDSSVDGSVLAYKDAMYFPRINSKDMVSASIFLLLLDSRTRHTPDTFANADMNSLRVGMKTPAIKPRYLGGYTMHLTGQEVPWTDFHAMFSIGFAV